MSHSLEFEHPIPGCDDILKSDKWLLEYISDRCDSALLNLPCISNPSSYRKPPSSPSLPEEVFEALLQSGTDLSHVAAIMSTSIVGPLGRTGLLAWPRAQSPFSEAVEI